MDPNLSSNSLEKNSEHSSDEKQTIPKAEVHNIMAPSISISIFSCSPAQPHTQALGKYQEPGYEATLLHSCTQYTPMSYIGFTQENGASSWLTDTYGGIFRYTLFTNIHFVMHWPSDMASSPQIWPTALRYDRQPSDMAGSPQIWLVALWHYQPTVPVALQFSAEDTLSCPKGGIPSIRCNKIWSLTAGCCLRSAIYDVYTEPGL